LPQGTSSHHQILSLPYSRQTSSFTFFLWSTRASGNILPIIIDFAFALVFIRVYYDTFVIIHFNLHRAYSKTRSCNSLVCTMIMTHVTGQDTLRILNYAYNYIMYNSIKLHSFRIETVEMRLHPRTYRPSGHMKVNDRHLGLPGPRYS
jgi:hypothetical protein